MSIRSVSRLALATALPLILSGCMTAMADLSSVRHHKMEASVIHTSPVRNSATPMSKPLACFGERMKASGKRPLGLAIGDIKDYTGKQGQDEGFAITQGGALMAYSALGKIGSAIRLHERFDTRIAEAELVYMNQRQLGDGRHHSVDDPNTGEKTSVPWKPYFGGTIRQSDYFIVGGITELNYNIQSGGAEFAVNNVGPRARIYTMNIAVDLRIVGTQTLMVYDTVSVEKQLSGYEIGAGVFRFFGSNLFDINVGAKNQEPLQLGVRTAIEAGILQLVASVAGVDPGPCIPPELGAAVWDGANAAAVRYDVRELVQQAVLKEEPNPSVMAEPLPAPSKGGAGLASYAPDESNDDAALALSQRFAGVEQETSLDVSDFLTLALATEDEHGLAADGGEFAVIFTSDSHQLDAMSEATIQQIAGLVENGRRVNLIISGKSVSGSDSPDQAELDEERIRTVVTRLMRYGVSRGRARLLWKATGVHPLSQQAFLGGGEGKFSQIARIRIG